MCASNSVKDLDSRLDQIESRLAIEELIAKYTYGFDTKNLDMLYSIIEDDTVLDFQEAGVYVGFEGFKQIAEASWASVTWMHHWQHTPLIEMQGERATGLVALECMMCHGEEGPVRVAGYYRDEYQRRHGVWKLTRRHFEMTYWALDPGFRIEKGSHLRAEL